MYKQNKIPYCYKSKLFESIVYWYEKTLKETEYSCRIIPQFTV